MGQQPEVDARGFTLLELIVTLLVVAIAVGLVAPAIGRSTEALRVRAEVAGFSATFRHARERAITTREPFTVAVNPTNHLLTVTTGEDEVRWTRALSGSVAIEARTPSALTVRFEPQGTSSGGEFRLTSGKIGYRVSVDAVTGRVRSLRE
jgi:prepilin-type N-terminal cleavage/methylation domain-containing protein